MKFYTSVIPHRGRLLVRAIVNGKRIQKRISYKPSLFVPVKKETKYKTLDGRPCERIKFDSTYEAREWLKQYDGVTGFEYFGNTRHQHAFISDEFKGNIEWDLSKLNTITIDIETECANGFPDPKTAIEPLLCVTIKSHSTKDIIVFGIGEYKNDNDKVTYHQFPTEQSLLEAFIKFWADYDPDIVTGWNCKFFDMPYLINRINYLLGESESLKLSPWGVVEGKKQNKQFGGEIEHYDILGVSILDYLDLYKKYTYTKLESYRLNFVAGVELGDFKDENPYDSFKEWYTNDYQSFVDYNIQDVELVDQLEDKMKLIELHLTMAYEAKVNFQEVFQQVTMWDAIIFNFLKDKGIVVPQKEDHENARGYEGAYVKDPIVGFHDWVVSYDLNSLYPHLIMQYNISPETIIGFQPELASVDRMLEGDVDFSAFDKRTMTPNGAIFRTDKPGFLGELMEKYYTDRSKYKKLMIIEQKKQQKDKDNKTISNNISKYNNIQMARKIALNSAYGAIGNKYCRYYDVRQAEGITLAGQYSIRFIQRRVNEYLNDLLKTDKKDYVVASDTDSIYIRMGDVVKKMGLGDDIKKTVNILDKFCDQKLKPYIDEKYQELADYTHAYKQKMVMDKEVIANKGIWTAKKRYILNVYNSEGVDYDEPKLKIMGIEAVKSSTPKACRDKIKEALKLIMTKDENALIEFIDDFKKQFIKLPAEEVSFPRSVNGLLKYQDNTHIYRKSTPRHVKGALIYNLNLRQDGKLLNKYETIKEGDKIKFLTLKMPNPFKDDVISFPTKLPKEFGLQQYVDYDAQFEKSFLDPLRFIVSAIGWNFERQASLESFFG